MNKITLVSIFAALVSAATSGGCLANDSTTRKDEAIQNDAMKLDGLLVWPRDRFSASDLLHLGDLEVEPHFCGCYDKPNKHYPYSLVLLKSSTEVLVARPERVDGPLTYMPLAIRRGNQYCDLESEKPCFGTFSDPCEFTDHRYGPSLAPFFPTCKTE